MSIVPAQYICLLLFFGFCIDFDKFAYFCGGCGMEDGKSNIASTEVEMCIFGLINTSSILTRHLTPWVSHVY